MQNVREESISMDENKMVRGYQNIWSALKTKWLR